MGKAKQIRCIRKNDFYNPCDRITHVGGVEPDGKPWKLTQREAIQGIEAGKWRFHVAVKGKRDWVIVAFNPFGSLYLKTENDEVEPNNLLNLPECP